MRPVTRLFTAQRVIVLFGVACLSAAQMPDPHNTQRQSTGKIAWQYNTGG